MKVLFFSVVVTVWSSIVWACEDYIAYQQGDIPVLLTSPHGAAKTQLLPGVPARTGEYVARRFVNRADQYTDKLTWRIAEHLQSQGLKPYVVVAGIHRSQIDFNRPANQAYESEHAAACYGFYHRSVARAVAEIKQKWSFGFMLDVHGQSKYPYDILRGTRNQQTIATLVERYQRDVSEEVDGFFYVLRGKTSYSIHPQRGKRERYYYGGFTLKTYGSHRAKGIDALQVEIGRAIRVDEGRREKMAGDLAEAISRFYVRYYQ